MELRTDLPLILDEIIKRLSKGLGAEFIYLFGSQAEGRATQGSDYDLLVVVPNSELRRHKREAISYDLLWGITTPVDVIVLTRKEFDKQSQVKTSLAALAKLMGIVLYERSKE